MAHSATHREDCTFILRVLKTLCVYYSNYCTCLTESCKVVIVRRSSQAGMLCSSIYLISIQIICRALVHTFSVVFKVWPCWPQRHFERPQLLYLATEMVVQHGFSVFWSW